MAKVKTAIRFKMQKQPVQESGGAYLTKKPHTLGLKVTRVAESQLRVHLTVPLTPVRRRAMGGIPDVL